MSIHINYYNIISTNNLLNAWREFLRGKGKRKDVLLFSLNLADNILRLHQELADKSYRHGQYQAFKINDPKPRDIHKASVRDRLLHHAIYRVLFPYFDKKFIFDSFSCRLGKGTHRAINRFQKYNRIVSLNNTRTVWVLKCDIKKFFASIDHKILLDILKKQIKDNNVVLLLGKVVSSFHTKDELDVGLPLGNLTSQLLVNIYMNEFDQFVKRQLKVKYYIRYADDFIVLSESKVYLENLLFYISKFLEKKLKLKLNFHKVFIKTIAYGVDFLGWLQFPHHRVLRTTTKRRMLKKLKCQPTEATINSYLGLLGHGNTYKLICLVNTSEYRCYLPKY